MFEIEYVENGSGNVIRARAKSHKIAQAVAKGIAKSKCKQVIVRRLKDTFNVWLYIPGEDRFVMVQSKPMDRCNAASFWGDWNHCKEGAVAVIWPSNIPMKLRVKDSLAS